MIRIMKCSIVFALILALGLSTYSFASGDKDKLNNVNKQINQTKETIKQNKKKENALAAEVGTIDAKIRDSEANLVKLQKELKETENSVAQARTDLENKKIEVNVQNDALNERLRAMYKNGEVGYLEIILGSESLGDLLSNMDMIQLIYEQDADMLAQLKSQYAAIEDKKQALETAKVNLENKKQSVVAQQQALETDKKEAVAIRQQVQADTKALEALEDELLAQANQISAAIRAASSSGTVYSGGAMAWPVPSSGRITSQYGNRIHPITKTKKMHTGLDIGAPTGSKIVAANDGTVIMSGWNGGYGNAVVIDHGGGITTLYGHNSKLMVSVGQKVTRGQQIAACGSTGNSTGPHCHFEVRINGKYTDPSPYLK